MSIRKALVVAGCVLALVVFNRPYLAAIITARTGGDAAAGAIALSPTPSTEANPEPVDDTSLAAAILDANIQYKQTDASTGSGWSTVHWIDAATAHRVEVALDRAARRTGLPINYLAAYVQHESTGDPQAELRNRVQWEAAQDDRARFAATDHGLVQISGRNLLAMFPGKSFAELKAKAEDIDFAADFLADYVMADMKWASEPKMDSRTKVDGRLSERAKNPYWLAVLAYNRGRPGVLRALGNPRACRYGDDVIETWRKNDARTGATSTKTVLAPAFPALIDEDPYRFAMGDIRPHVEAIQRLLNDRLALATPLSTDGNFGPATRDALIRFQREHDLEESGATDPRTWEALLGLKMSGDAGAPQPLIIGNAGPHVEALQRRLNERLDPSPALNTDGKFGRATRDAMIRYQRDHNLPPTGAADAATWSTLLALPGAT